MEGERKEENPRDKLTSDKQIQILEDPIKVETSETNNRKGKAQEVKDKLRKIQEEKEREKKERVKKKEIIEKA